MKLLPPQRLRPHYYEATEQALRSFFDVTLFTPLLGIVTTAAGVTEFENAPSAADMKALRAALRSGRIWYKDGHFGGDFDAATTRALRGLGAVLERAGGFALRPDLVPAWVNGEVAAFQAQAAELTAQLQKLLGETRVRLEGGQLPLPLDAAAAAAADAIEEGFESAADALAIHKRIPASQRAEMERRYREDVRPYVVADTAKYIDELHEVVQENAAAGFRFEHLVDDFERIHGISERKARFLARQETSLFMAGYRRERFTAAGVRRYKWDTSHDIRVRPYNDEAQRRKYGDHRALNGQLFYYDTKAPASYMSSKKPCNPGEDFQCRCVDLAVVE